MIDSIINDDKTIAGGGEGAILVGRNGIFCRLWQGGIGGGVAQLKYTTQE